MTETQALRVVCQAAALDDIEAAALLCQHLEALPPDVETRRTLIGAHAWIDPVAAKVWAQNLPEPDSFEHREVEKLHKAHILRLEGREQQEAYNTITALLPSREVETMRRKQVYYWAVALTSPEDFLALPEWFLVMNSPFLVARLWHNHTERLWEALRHNQGLQAHFSSIGQVMLASRANERDVAILVEFLKNRSTPPAYSGLAASSLFHVIGVLEVRAPQEMATLAPEILCTLGRSSVEKDSVLTARMLVLLARLELDGLTLITPLLERVKAKQNHRVARRWARHVARMVRQFEPVPSEAHRLARLLRVLALEKVLESALTRKLEHRTQARVRRAWRWLQKSDRVIKTVADAEWRKRFSKSKANLELKVNRSRKLVHVRARAGYVE